MKKIELIVGLIAVLSVFLKVFHITGGIILLASAFYTLSTVYYVFGFALFNNIRLRDIFKKASYKDTTVKRIIGAVGLGWAISAIISGGLFKLQLWPGAGILLPTGLVSIGIILIIAIIFYFRSKADYYKGIFKRIAIYAVLGLVFYLTPNSTLVDIYYRYNPEIKTEIKVENTGMLPASYLAVCPNSIISI